MFAAIVDVAIVTAANAIDASDNDGPLWGIAAGGGRGSKGGEGVTAIVHAREPGSTTRVPSTLMARLPSCSARPGRGGRDNNACAFKPSSVLPGRDRWIKQRKERLATSLTEKLVSFIACGLVVILAGSVCNVWDFFWYKPTTRRLVPIFYANLRPAGAQTVLLLRFLLQMYATQQKTSILNNNHPTKNNTMVKQVTGLAARLRCFEPPHPRETLWEGLAEGGFERFNIVFLNDRDKK